MRRIWVNREEIRHPEFELGGDSFHHAIQVCRFRVGEQFEVVSGEDEALQVELVEIKKKSAKVKVLGKRALAPIPMPYIQLAFAVSKWSTFETVLEKAVELGVKTVQPLITEFSFIRNKKEWPSSRTERMQKIIRSATEQCARGQLMTLLEPITLEEFLAKFNRTDRIQGLFAYEGSSDLDVKAYLSNISAEGLEQMWALIGSEGGFSEAEVAQIQNKGLPAVTMGSQILRAETACLAIVSVIKYELGLMR